MGLLDLIAVAMVCGSLLAYRALTLRDARARAAQEDEHAADLRMIALEARRYARRAKTHASTSAGHATQASQSRVAFDEVVAGLNTNFDRIDTNFTRLNGDVETLKQAAGWQRHG
jgi:hypothetical protein